jgi:ATP-binding cassette subfamily F protein 3
MLQVRDLNYSIGARELLLGINWIIQPHQRVALIGPNGAGKTTLLRIFIGEIPYQSGTIIKPKGYRIGYLPQEEIAVGRGTILDAVLEGKKHVVELEMKIAELHQALDSTPENHDELLKQLGNLEQQFEAHQGYQLEATAKSILSGLGFSDGDFSRQLSEFSGGWRMRAYLARLLIQNPDLLLLDEPTNHLDLPSLEWLEQYLLSFAGSMVVVSHDRFFIDRLAQEIYELDRGKLEHYPGNYHFYEQKKLEKEEQLRKLCEEVRAERERQQRFIDRFRYKATKAAQVQSRIKRLEKLEEIELPPAQQRFNFKLTVNIHSYKDVVKIENMSFRYNGDWVLENVNLNIYRGEKIALVGANGAGKTTLTRLIAGELKCQVGTLDIGNRTTIGYYAQHQVDALDLNATVYDEVTSHTSPDKLSKIRDILGVFQIRGDDVFKRIEVLSGGEKARVSLAKILLSPVNFLIMDEPTNHLDMASRDALEQALSDYDGTLLIISHDRYFLDKLVHRVVEIKDRQVKEYEGNYSDYLAKREANLQEQIKVKDKSKNITGNKKTKEQKRIEAEARQAISKDRNRLTNEIERLEAKIAALEKRKSEIENLMANPDTYKNSELATTLPFEYSRIQEELQSSYDRWEQAQVELDEVLKKIN